MKHHQFAFVPVLNKIVSEYYFFTIVSSSYIVTHKPRFVLKVFSQILIEKTKRILNKRLQIFINH